MSQLPRPKGIVERMRAIEAELRWQHVDIQRLWKRAPGLGEFAYLGAANEGIEFDEPASEQTGGTAGSNTYGNCQSRYAGDVYQLPTTFAGQPTKTNPFANISKVIGPPNDDGATIVFPTSREPLLEQSYYVYTRGHNFAIPAGVTISSVFGYIRYRTPTYDPQSGGNVGAYPGVKGFLLHVNGVVLNFCGGPSPPLQPGGLYPSYGLDRQDWFEAWVIKQGIGRPFESMDQFPTLTPEVVNNTGFGCGMWFSGHSNREDIHFELDSIRLHICWQEEIDED